MTLGAALLSVGALILSATILVAGNSLQFVILGLRAEAEGIPLATIGAMTAGYFIGYSVGSIYSPRFVNAIGHIRAFAALASITSGVVLAHGLWVEPTFWIGLRFVTGLCFAGLATVTDSWLNARATSDLRGRLLSLAGVAMITGYAVGPVFAALGSVDSLVLFVIASMLMSMALVPVTLTRYEAPAISLDGEGAETYSLARLFKETQLGVLGCFVAGSTQGAFLGLGVIFAGRLGLDNAAASLFVTLALAAGALSQYPIGWLSDQLDRRHVIAGLAGAVGIASLVVMATQPSAQPALVWFGLAAFVAGVAAMPMYAIVVAYVYDRIPENSIVPAAATLVLTYAVGSAVAGPLASWAMVSYGPSGLYLYMGLLMLAFAMFALVRIAVREAPDVAEETDAIVARSPGLAPLDAFADEIQLALPLEEGDVAGS